VRKGKDSNNSSIFFLSSYLGPYLLFRKLKLRQWFPRLPYSIFYDPILAFFGGTGVDQNKIKTRQQECLVFFFFVPWRIFTSSTFAYLRPSVSQTVPRTAGVSCLVYAWSLRTTSACMTSYLACLIRKAVAFLCNTKPLRAPNMHN
jgi:hypothetical protein